MATFAGGEIEAFVGPPELGASDDLEEVIIKFIEGATETLDIAIQELDSLLIAQALLDASWRGVAVRIVLEQDYLQDEKIPDGTPEAGETPQADEHGGQPGCATPHRRPRGRGARQPTGSPPTGGEGSTCRCQ
jgi:hypothetical protein